MKTYIFHDSSGKWLMIHVEKKGFYKPEPYDGRDDVIGSWQAASYNNHTFMFAAVDGAKIENNENLKNDLNGCYVQYHPDGRQSFIGQVYPSVILSLRRTLRARKDGWLRYIGDGARAFGITLNELPQYRYYWRTKTADPADRLLLENLRRLPGICEYDGTYEQSDAFRIFSRRHGEWNYYPRGYPEKPGTYFVEFYPDWRLFIRIPLRHSIHLNLHNQTPEWWRIKTFHFDPVGFVVEARDLDVEFWQFNDPNSPAYRLDNFLRSSYSNKFLEYYFANRPALEQPKG